MASKASELVRRARAHEVRARELGYLLDELRFDLPCRGLVAQVTREGRCLIETSNLDLSDALAFAAWLVDTFGESGARPVEPAQ